jgi:ABC-type lipoprotein export system ATPase subunit
MIVPHDRSLADQMDRVLHLLDGRIDRDRANGNGSGGR